VVYAAGPEILTAHVFTVRGRGSCPGAKGEADGDEVKSDDPLLAARASDGCSIVLDRLHLSSNGRALSEAAGARLAAVLREVLLGQRSIEDVLQAAGKTTSLGITPHRIAARNDLSDEHTVISVLCDTVPGLLYHVTHALAAINLDIHTAKITSWGGRAEDAFYVTQRRPDGRSEKISDEAIGEILAALREKLRKPAE
jgi:UTP:GlnB (protein PII) uridylyltransferase